MASQKLSPGSLSSKADSRPISNGSTILPNPGVPSTSFLAIAIASAKGHVLQTEQASVHSDLPVGHRHVGTLP